PDDGPVEHHGVTADERPVLDRAVLHRHAVADRAVVADGRPAVPAHVNDGVVLNAGPRADPDRAVVAPYDDAEPDARLLTNLNVADQHGGRRDKSRGCDLRTLAV